MRAAAPGHVGDDSSTERRTRGAWRRAARIATACEGAISLAELVASGLTGVQVWHAARTGRLFRRYRGVYLLGHEFATLRTRLFLAVKACGPDAVLSHLTAARFWGLVGGRDGPVHVTVPTRRRRRRGIILHRAQLDVRAQVTHRRGFAVTTVARTIADCAGTVPAPVLAAMIDEADHRRMLTPRTVRRILEEVDGRPGAARLARLLADRDPSSGRPRNWLERRWARFARDWELPPSVRGRHIDLGAGELREMDVFFPATSSRPGRVVELDVFRTHDERRRTWARDRRRDRRLMAVGILTMRVTELDLDGDERELAEDAWRFLGDDARADAVRSGAWTPTRRAAA